MSFLEQTGGGIGDPGTVWAGGRLERVRGGKKGKGRGGGGEVGDPWRRVRWRCRGAEAKGFGGDVLHLIDLLGLCPWGKGKKRSCDRPGEQVRFWSGGGDRDVGGIDGVMGVRGGWSGGLGVWRPLGFRRCGIARLGG